MTTQKQMGRPARPKVEGHGRGTWEARLHSNRERQKTQTKLFLLESMKETEARYVSYLAELDELDKQYQAALAAAKAVQAPRPDAPLQKKKPAAPTEWLETPYGPAREGAAGELYIHSPKPVHERWTAWCNKHRTKYLKAFIAATYLYTGPIIVDELPETRSQS